MDIPQLNTELGFEDSSTLEFLTGIHTQPSPEVEYVSLITSTHLRSAVLSEQGWIYLRDVHTNPTRDAIRVITSIKKTAYGEGLCQAVTNSLLEAKIGHAGETVSYYSYDKGAMIQVLPVPDGTLHATLREGNSFFPSGYQNVVQVCADQLLYWLDLMDIQRIKESIQRIKESTDASTES